MKSNVSFSQIELTFNQTDIKYIHCHAPVKRSPTVWRNSTGWVFMRGMLEDVQVFKTNLETSIEDDVE